MQVSVQTISIPRATLIRWTTWLPRCIVIDDISTYGPVLVERDGRVLVKIDGQWRKAVEV